ncbi:claudin-15-like isoform X2 [Chiloscyllium plagiosum]|uniref:claudin-15-like isoform X2 n=1 Tax=Chiloscyllium plagiosum TaxID=36176 RepID=UPI001CB83364|nr:claudin-15-like isoform X2 [Chiloscyllium plagiosum]
MAAAIEITGFLMGVAGWMLTGSTLANNYWKISTVFGSVITSSRLYENLWKSCAQDSTGVFNCRMFETMLGLSSYIQACRALMIISIILGVIGTLMALFGLKCTNIGSMDEKAKGKISLSGGLVFILSGICAMVPISWYAYNITMEFYNPVYGGTKYELGSALYIGWAGASLLILGGAFLCCSCKRNAQPSGYKYSSAQSGQRIYTKTESAHSKAYV